MAEKSGYIATTKFLIASPTKVRPVANVIKRKTCSEAMAILENMLQEQFVTRTISKRYTALLGAINEHKYLNQKIIPSLLGQFQIVPSLLGQL